MRKQNGLSYKDSSYDEDGMDDSISSRTRRSRSLLSQSLPKSRQYPIQVVLRPPPDPTEYERIESSQAVERILGEIEVDDELFYSIEYDDGFIEEVGDILVHTLAQTLFYGHSLPLSKEVEIIMYYLRSPKLFHAWITTPW